MSRRMTTRPMLGARSFVVSRKAGGGLTRATLGIGLDDVFYEAHHREAIAKARPKTRGDCVDGERPCPWVACRHSLVLDVSPTGSIKINRHLKLELLDETCALDVADRGGATLEAVGAILNLTRERTRQIEVRALMNAKSEAKRKGLRDDDLSFPTAGTNHPEQP